MMYSFRPFLIILLVASAPALHAQNAMPAPLDTLTHEHLGMLKWLEGNWRGTGVSQPAFYERYRIANDSTIVSYTPADSAFRSMSDSSAIRLRSGRIISGTETSQWAVARIDENMAVFVPVRGARNAFSWTRTGPDTWTAVLESPPAPGRPATRTVYEMVRVGPHP